MMVIIGWLILGGIAGWIAGKLVGGSGNGVVINILVGIVGAVAAGWVASQLLDVQIDQGFNLATLVIAIIGAAVLLLIANALGLRHVGKR